MYPIGLIEKQMTAAQIDSCETRSRAIGAEALCYVSNAGSGDGRDALARPWSFDIFEMVPEGRLKIGIAHARDIP